MKKNLKRLVSLSVIMVFLLFNYSVYAHQDLEIKTLKNESTEYFGDSLKFYPNEHFYNASLDDVIFYSEHQIPITKKDILDGSFENKMNISLFFEDTITVDIPRGRTSAIAVENISVPRYYQTNEHLWLTNLEGANYASSIEAGQGEQILAILSGFIPKVGTLVSLVWSLKMAQQSNMASEIRKVTNKGDCVEVVHIKSNYGKAFTAKYWNGEYITVLKPIREESNHMYKIISSSYSFK